MEILMIFGGFGQEKTKPNKANFEIAAAWICRARIAACAG